MNIKLIKINVFILVLLIAAAAFFLGKMQAEKVDLKVARASNAGSASIGRTSLDSVEKPKTVNVVEDKNHERSPLVAESDKPIFRPFSPYGKEIFPSMILTWSGSSASTKGNHVGQSVEARHYGQNCQIGVILENVKKGEIYEISIQGDRFIKNSSIRIDIAEDAQSVTAGPTTIYDYREIQSLRQTVFFDITFQVSKNNSKGETLIDRWQAHQLNDCPTFLERSFLTPAGGVDKYYLPWPTTFAGYVNENHPWVDFLLREALETKICDSFVGYSSDEAVTITQVMAVWEALRNRRISYSNIAVSTESSIHKFQHVRFIEESINSAQANCVDGSVLLVSLLRKIGLNVGLVVVPGHAYVVVYDKEEQKRWFAIETTMVGSSSLEDSIRHATYDSEFALVKIAKHLSDRSQNTYIEIPINRYRSAGVLPIPYTGSNSVHWPLSSAREKPSAPSTRFIPGANYPKSRSIGVDDGFVDDAEQRRYLSSRGIRSAMEADREMRDFGSLNYEEAHRYDHLTPKDAAWMRRKELAAKLSKSISSISSGLKADANYLGKIYYWRDTVAEINAARKAFVSLEKTPGINFSEISSLNEEEKARITEDYRTSVRVLQSVDPYSGVDPALIPPTGFPEVVRRAEMICAALFIVASLPLDY